MINERSPGERTIKQLEKSRDIDELWEVLNRVLISYNVTSIFYGFFLLCKPYSGEGCNTGSMV